MSTQRVFKTVVSSKKYLTVECSNDRCPARVHGYLRKNDIFWVVSDHVQHTCVIMNQLLDHKNLSFTLIARLFYTQIVEDKAMEVKVIQKTLKLKYKYNISYGKAWRAKQTTLENRFGSFFDSYDSVVRMLHTLQERNLGTYVDIQDSWMAQDSTLKVLK
jgi:hypothetical protein